MALNDGSKIEAVAENVYTRIIARYSMIAVSCVGLPLTMWSINEAYSVIKSMSKEQAQLTRSVDLLSQKVEFTNASQRAGMAQAELRIQEVRAELRDRTQGRYSSDDAARDLKLRDQVLEQHERRITDLERSRGVGGHH